MKYMNSSLREKVDGYIFISPWIIGFFLFYAIPMGFSFIVSFCNWDFLQNLTFIGLGNYFKIFSKDGYALSGLRKTATFVALEIPLQLGLSLGIAYLLTQKIKGAKITRAVVYLPAVISGAVGGVIWRYMFNTQTGVFNYLLSFVGVKPIPWIDHPDIALYSIVLTGIWAIGQPMILFLAAMEGVPKNYYESAEIDGAGKLSQFFKITLPLISPTIFLNLIIVMIQQFQMLAPIIVITGGGPVKATYLYSYVEYQNAFKYLKMGYASALSWFMFFIILILALVLFKTSNKWVYYHSERGNTK
jgi:multiple sugar transport system permease protein